MTASADWLEAHLGPVEVVSIALPESAAPDAWHVLLSAVDAHQLRILDLEFIRRTDAGAEGVAAADVPGLDLPDPAGASQWPAR